MGGLQGPWTLWNYTQILCVYICICLVLWKRFTKIRNFHQILKGTTNDPKELIIAESSQYRWGLELRVPSTLQTWCQLADHRVGDSQVTKYPSTGATLPAQSEDSGSKVVRLYFDNLFWAINALSLFMETVISGDKIVMCCLLMGPFGVEKTPLRLLCPVLSHLW